MKHLFQIFFGLLAVAILPACSKKPVDVSGQIFVVTKGRENIKMGGVEVRVIPDGEFRTMAKVTMLWMQEEVRAEAARKADSTLLTAFINEVLAMEKAAPALIPELSVMRKMIVEESGVSKSLLDPALSGRLSLRGIKKLISGGASTLSVTTDADGRFTVPTTGKTWFIANGQREVGKETEEYLWVKSFEPQAGVPNSTLTISNSADLDSEDDLYSVLSGAIHASGELAEFRKVEVSEKLKSLVARYREAAVVARAKAEKEAAEARVKLAAEIGAGRIGATIGVRLAENAVMPFAFCPRGTFRMGSPSSEEGRSNGEKQVSVTLSEGFWMAKTEVTQAQWQAVMGTNPSIFKGINRPLEKVSWADAQEFIKRVNGSGVIPGGWKFALPTEAQWEYACRAGEVGPYAGGTIEQVAWYGGNSAGQTHDVGTKQANAWGLHDMHGNVREWCADWLDDTLPGGTDPTGASSGSFRVYRGGSWSFRAGSCRAADRLGNTPGYRDYGLGFRLCLSSETIR
jgi:formylglycine-generating enzyme required for sulfatase activity